MQETNQHIEKLASEFQPLLEAKADAGVCYDIDGIHQLEAFVNEIRSELIGKEWDEISQVVMGMSSFFAQCLRAELGGECIPDEKSGYALEFPEGKLFPTDWIMQFVENEQEQLVEKLKLVIGSIPEKSLSWISRHELENGEFEIFAKLQARSPQGIGWKMTTILNQGLKAWLAEENFSGKLKYKVCDELPKRFDRLESWLEASMEQLNEAIASAGDLTQKGERVCLSFEFVNSNKSDDSKA